MILANSLIADRYRLRQQIARGGMAEVWEAQDDVLGRPVAVKLLLPELAADPVFLERFRREAIAAARLAHPNIVATYDTGLDDGLAYIVMELVTGRTLKDELARRGGSLPIQDATTIAGQVAAALHYAHQSGIVHRDVKPANILICPDGRVKVADFGIAKAAVGDGTGEGQDLTATGMIIGTAKYLSPEQVEGRPVDARADVYGLGVVLYEMLCGRPPFEGETEMAIGIQHLERRPLSPRQVKAGIPRSLEAVVMRSLSKAPEERFPSAAELQSALLSVDLRNDDAVPLIVREDTPPRGVPSFTQSERPWMVPTAVIVVIAVTLGIVGWLFARSEPGQRLLGNGPGGGNGAAGAAPVAVAGITSFDPDGDGVEHESDVGNLVDGNPATTWSTQTYNGPNFARLKPGLGIVLNLAAPTALGELKLLEAGPGFEAEVVVADAPAPTRSGWGEAVGKKRVDGEATFDLGGRTGGAVLLWITNPSSSSVTIGEVQLTG